MSETALQNSLDPLEVCRARLTAWLTARSKPDYSGEWSMTINYNAGKAKHFSDGDCEDYQPYRAPQETTLSPYSKKEIADFAASCIQCLGVKLASAVSPEFWGSVSIHVRMTAGRIHGVRCSSTRTGTFR